MAIRGLRKIDADIIRLEANEALSAGMSVEYADAAGVNDTTLRRVEKVDSSGTANFVGIVLDRVIAKPALAQDSSDADKAGIHSDWVFTEATPLFQEEGVRYVGEEVAIMRKGYISTDQIPAGQTPSGGLLAYAQPNGLVGTTASGYVIGQWQSSADSDGYCELYVHPAYTLDN